MHYCGEQIFEMIEKKGYSVGCISPMNTINNLKKPAYFNLILGQIQSQINLS